MGILLLRILKYVCMATFVVPVAIVSHELGHFLCYIMFGAEGVRLLAFSVAADTKQLASWQLAVSSMTGPVISYLTIVVAALMTRKQYSPAWVMLGIAAPIGRIVNAIYIYFRVLGYDPKPNFDEYKFSRSIGIDPLIVGIPTMAIVAITFLWFGRLAWKNGRYAELVLIILSILLGLGVWSQIGPWILL